MGSEGSNVSHNNSYIASTDLILNWAHIRPMSWQMSWQMVPAGLSVSHCISDEEKIAAESLFTPEKVVIDITAAVIDGK